MNIRLLILPIAVTAIGLSGCEVNKEPDGDSKVAVSDEVAEGAKRAADTTADVASQVAMTAKIESTLRGAESLKIEDLNVDTVDKTITLKGYVESEEQKAKAEQLTKAMAGAGYTINNMLAVKSKV
jgi:hyperosmotically inducible periplasmic protein